MRSESKCSNLQEDLDSLSAWCNKWKLQLNISKCNSITFTNKRKNIILFDYDIAGIHLNRVQEVKDLGVTIASNLTYDTHLRNIRGKAHRLLGLLRRNCLNTFSKRTNKILYVSLVRPQLEYASVVWSPYHVTKVNIIESVQKRFFKLLCFHSKINYNDFNYSALCTAFNLFSLVSRRDRSDMIFLYKICNDHMDSCLIQYINFYVPNRFTRARQTFRINKVRINVSKFATLNRLQTSYNHHINNIDTLDIFVNTLLEFKNLVNVSLRS